MAFNFKELVKEQARKVGFFNRDHEDTRGAMPNGGTMGYYPNSKARDLFGTQGVSAEQVRQADQQAQQAQQNAQAQQWPQQGTGFTPNAGAQQPQQSQQQANDPVAQYTSGFTGFQQPVKNMQSWQTQDTTMPPVSQQTGYQQPAAQAYPQQGTGYQQPVAQAYPQQGTGYQQPAAQAYPQQGTGYQQPAAQTYPQQNTGYQQPVAQAYPQQNTGYQQPVMQAYPQQGTGYQQPVSNQAWQQPQPQQHQPQYQTPQQRAMGFDAEDARPQRQSKRQQRAQQPQQPVNNIVYMPNTGFTDESGRAYTHMERVVQLVSVSACFRVIEFMRNGESVIVNTENIASETDTQRCLDLLAGAAFTMGSSMTKITQLKRAYLIAPQNVMVMADVAVNNWADRDSARDQFETEAPEHYRPVRGAYVPDRQDEMRRDHYQAQQERMRQGYTGREMRYAENFR